MAFPRFVVLKSKDNSKFMSYVYETGQAHGLLRFSGEDVTSPNSKMKVEMAESGSGLVHLRCCYNNKYWVRSSANDSWIVAAAEVPEENQSKWSCTLFKPVFKHSGDDGLVQFLHVQLGNYACSWSSQAPFTNCLYAGSKSPPESQSVFSFTDWESLVILPKYVAFKGSNGKYIKIKEKYSFQLESSGDDIGDPLVGNEILTRPDGTIRVKSIDNDLSWAAVKQDNLVLSITSDWEVESIPSTIFRPTKVTKNVIALRNLGDDSDNIKAGFCYVGSYNSLKYGSSTIPKEARLEVEELVISREIYNVNFRLMDARIYNQSVLVMATKDVVNMTGSTTETEVELSYTKSTSSTWNTSLSLTLGVKTTMTAGVPEIAEASIEISAEVQTAYEWGETKETSLTLRDKYTVPVPPNKRVKVSMLATRGTCQVPFSYTQRDTMIDGRVLTRTFNDGVYTGVNSYNFKYETKQEDL